MNVEEPAGILSSINKSLQKSLLDKPSANSSEQAPEEVDKDQRGFKSDFEIIAVLDEALLHPCLEVIQIIECLQDYS